LTKLISAKQIGKPLFYCIKVSLLYVHYVSYRYL